MVRGIKLALAIGLLCTAGLLTTAALGTLIYVRLYVGWYYQIPQNGMYPNFPAGSRIFGISQPYQAPSRVARGDVVIFPRSSRGNHYVYIFRVVGLGGDTVEIDGDDVFIFDSILAKKW